MRRRILALLDIQHRGRSAHPLDYGAAADLDRDGLVEDGEREAELTPFYALACSDVLGRLDQRVLLITAGAYSDRHSAARALAAAWAGPVVYLACHINAGGGTGAIVAHDERSRGGAALARAIVSELGGLPGIARASARPVGARSPEAFERRLHGCIGGIYEGPANLCGVTLEPFFLDQLAHAPLATDEGLRRVGEAIARGVLASQATP